MDLLDRLDLGAAGTPSRRELRWLAAIALLGLVVRLVVVFLDRHHGLAGDELTYNRYGTFAEDGHWLWATEPFGEPHASYWKMPLYPLVTGLAYNLGLHHHGLEYAQTLLGPLTIGLTWLLARRLFGSAKIALAAAAVMAVYPFAWQYQLRLFPEAIAVPIMLGILVAGLDRPPTTRRAALLGVLTGFAVLARPNAFVLLAALVLGWVFEVGLRRTVVLALVAGACMAVVLTPWTLRNHGLTGDWQPLSVQDAAIYGTFNDTAANDEKQPWAWRIYTPGVRELLKDPVDDGEFKRRLKKLGTDYIKDHPESVLKAAYWNGFRRAWDLRSPDEVMDSAAFAGATRGATLAGLIMYWLMLPLALLALWRVRHRRALFVAIVAAVLALSATEITVAATRYRGPIEPLIVVLACAGALGARAAVRDPAS